MIAFLANLISALCYTIIAIPMGSTKKTSVLEISLILHYMFSIKNVIVDKISLISRGKRPAVAKAETKFSIFKTAIGIEKKLSPEIIQKLEDISKAYDKKTLYVSRKVKNGKEILKWAEDQGISDLVKLDDLHVTIAFSKSRVKWDDFIPDTKDLDVSLEWAKIENLGDAVVIKFKSKDLEKGWKKYMDGGASWDYESYQPHVSVSYSNDQDISKVGKYSWTISFWGEVMEEIKKEFIKKLEEISRKYGE